MSGFPILCVLRVSAVKIPAHDDSNNYFTGVGALETDFLVNAVMSRIPATRAASTSRARQRARRSAPST